MRGDVVVFRLPRDPSQTYIKRVIGLPGDHVQMIGGRLWINGKKLALRPDGQGKVESEDGSDHRLAALHRDSAERKSASDLQVDMDRHAGRHAGLRRARGHFFMMGDNRDNSLDSRVAAENGGVGFVPAENLVGRAEFVVGSYDFLNAHAIWTWLAEFRLSRFFNGVS